MPAELDIEPVGEKVPEVAGEVARPLRMAVADQLAEHALRAAG